jgi:hypothetical protein
MAQRTKKERGKAAKMNPERLRSFYEGRDRTGVSYWTLWRGAEAGFFKTVYVGGRRMIPESELARIVEYGFGGRKRKAKQGSAETAETAVEAR